MKRIYRLKVYISIIFGLVLLLCAFDYLIVEIYGKRAQLIWPIYHWGLGFEKVSTKIYKGHILVTFCDTPLKEPISIKKFIRSQNIEWHDTRDYKYILIFSDIIYNKKDRKIKKSFESHILSQLSCNKLVYSLFIIIKNLRTKREDKIFLQTFEYKKPIRTD